MSLSPFTQGQRTPLSVAPYYSRVASQELVATPKNYVMTGFRPGYALQASELNELQERFFLNQTLTTTMLSNWGQAMGSGGNYYGPGWGSGDAEGSVGGLTPISPGMITKNGNEITFAVGWYLAQIPEFDSDESEVNDTTFVRENEINFKVWIYSDTERSATIGSGGEGYIGFNIRQEYETEGEDTDLNDNSSGEGTGGPGATRYQLVITGLGSVDFSPDGTILLADKSPMAIKVTADGNVSYLNGYPIEG